MEKEEEGKERKEEEEEERVEDGKEEAERVEDGKGFLAERTAARGSAVLNRLL